MPSNPQQQLEQLQRRPSEVGPRSHSDLVLGSPGLPGGRNRSASELDEHNHSMDNSRNGADSSRSTSSTASVSSTDSNNSNNSTSSYGRQSSFSRRSALFGAMSSKNSGVSREASPRRASNSSTGSASNASDSSSNGRQRWHRLMNLHKKSRSAQDLASNASHYQQQNNDRAYNNNIQPPPLERITSANSNSSGD